MIIFKINNFIIRKNQFKNIGKLKKLKIKKI